MLPNDDLTLWIQLRAKADQANKEVDGLVANLRRISGEAKTAGASMGAGLNSAATTTEKLNRNLKDTEKSANKASQGLRQFWNTVKGTLTAMLVFYTTQPLIEFFSSALKAATDFRKAFASLSFAESILSQRGMDITRQELDDIVKNIEEKYKYLGTLEVTGIVSTVADMGAEFNLTKEQVTGLSDAVAFLQLKEQAYGQEVSDVGSIVNAALDGRSNFFNRLGINITKTAIAEKAYAMGLAEQGAQLTKEQSNQAAIALLIEQTAGKYDELLASIEQVNPALANQMRITKEMKDSQLEVGNSILDVKDAWNEFLSALIERGDLDSLKAGLISFIEALGDVIGLFTSMYQASKDLKDSYSEFGGELADTGSKLEKWISPANAVLTFLQLLFLGFTTVVGAIVTAIGILSEFFAYASGAKTYEEAGRAVGEHFSNGLLDGIAIGLRPLVAGKDDALANSLRQTMELLGKDISTPTWPDTPTSPGGGGIEDDQSNLQNALEKMNNEILEAQIKLAQDMEEAAIDLGRKLEDIAIEYAKKRADAERDHANTVRDINTSYAQKVNEIRADEAEASAKARNDELEREAEFQNKMLELKENYLMDLEEALHERDARQILRLMKQYNLDKTQAERDHALDNQRAQRDVAEKKREFARRRQEAEAERKAKLAEANQDLKDKLAKLQADEEAERRAANLTYERKMQDLQREMHNRLSLVAASLVKEFNLTEEGLDAIYKLYQSYYGDISQIYSAMNTMLSGQSRITIPTATPGGGGAGGGSRPAQAYAEGGTLVANQPTTVTFGEAGLEMAQFTPIGRRGRDVNKLFTSLGQGGGSMDGTLEVDVTLSPDLEARIVKRSMDETAGIITRVKNSKRR